MCHRRAQTLQGRLSPPMPHSAAQRTSIAVKKDVKQQLETYTTATTDESEPICMPIHMSDINLYMVSLARQQRRSLTWPASTEHQRLGRVQSVSAWATARYFQVVLTPGWLDSRLDAIWDARRQPERGVGTFAFTLSTFPCGSGRRRAAARSWRLLRESESNGSQLTLDLSSIGNYVLLHHIIPRLAQHNLLSS